MMVRCKFKLMQVTEQLPSATWDAKFMAVYGDENNAFWHATPSGELVARTVTHMPFTIGQDYYLHITPVV